MWETAQQRLLSKVVHGSQLWYNVYMKECTRCKVVKSHDDFAKKAARKDGLQSICKDCMKIIKKAHYEANKAKVIASNKVKRQAMVDKVWAYKQGKSCLDCSNSDPRVLEFDHTSDDKSGNVSTMANNGCSWATIEAEIAKCDLVCANCHRIRTWERAEALGGRVRNITVIV